MKNTAYKILIIATISLQAVLVTAQKPRNVIWLHGLDGSENSWKHYEQLFTSERYINSLRKQYEDGTNINASSSSVKTIMDSYLKEGATDSRNIAIGHSMGGIVARNMDRIYSSKKNFGGIITVASSNYGAPAANSMLDGSVESYANNASVKLLAGPLIQNPLTAPIWAIGGLCYIGFVITPTKIVSWISGEDELQNMFGNQLINNDLKVGSPTINAMNAYNTTTPRISMWAQENSPVHWRLIGSFLGEHAGSSYNDQPFVDKINQARSTYNGYYQSSLALGTAMSITAVFEPWVLPFAAYEFLCASQWKMGRDWFDSSESGWKTLIKASRKELQPITVCGYTCIPSGDDDHITKTIPNPCSGYEWTCQTQNYWVTVHHPSDGFNPKYTQILTNVPSGNVYQIDNANHIEVRNMSHKGETGDNTKKEFKKIWDDRPYGDFFRTPKR